MTSTAALTPGIFCNEKTLKLAPVPAYTLAPPGLPGLYAQPHAHSFRNRNQNLDANTDRHQNTNPNSNSNLNPASANSHAHHDRARKSRGETVAQQP